MAGFYTGRCVAQGISLRLKGVFGFSVTPFRSDLSLDLDASKWNAYEMAAYRFCGLVAAGGTGELYSLTPEERVKGYEVAAIEMLGKSAGPVRPPLQNCRPQDTADLRSLVEVCRQVPAKK